MCSRCKLLWNIEEKTIEEVLTALSRMARLYIILAVFSIFYIYKAVINDHLFDIVYECCILILFVLYVYFLRVMTAGLSSASPTAPLLDSDATHTSRIPDIKKAGVVVILISIAYSARIVYYALDDFSAPDMTVSLVSLLIQLSTLYLLNKLINKITFGPKPIAVV